MTEVEGGELVKRYRRAVAASRELPDAQRAAAESWRRRVSAEDELANCLQAVHRVSGSGPATWFPRLSGRLTERRASIESSVRQLEGEAAQAVAEHKAAVERLMLTQSRADDLAAAREAASSALTGPNAELAQAALAEANELAEALFAAQSAHLAATGVNSELSTAGKWSTYDTFFGGGMIASMMKQESVQSADDASQPLVNSLTMLRSELQDLNAPTAYFAVQTNDLTASLDVWWDNIFSDLTMARRIDDAQLRVQRLLVGLDQLAAQLGERRQAALERLDALIAGSTAS
ncbi:MAG TPA: hypothetical protein VMT88_05440 [Actinomycetes bacterium]|nr:hypothetical protein [Actinomycetes bacterium]